ncbi:MAG: glycine--tRNA ligase subunit beta [Alphaproteobacteria bacterium]
MPELLLEFLSEEIPARMQARAAADLERLILKALAEAELSHGAAKAYATPRRVTLVVDGLPEMQPDRRIERKGPRTDAPEKAIQGFLGSVGLSLEQCEVRESGKGSFYYAVTERVGRPTAEILAEIIAGTAREFPWPKSMRWSSNAFRWVRPLHSVLAIFDGKVVEGGIPLGNGELLPYGDTTRGHRFLAPGEIRVSDFADYRARLLEAHVMLDPVERRRHIHERAKAEADAAGFRLRQDEDLLDEVAGLVEWPVVLMGRIDPDFMAVPPEVLTTAMRSHQKYFAVVDRSGKLAPHFVCVANMATDDEGAEVVEGNERVLRARLSDAGYFWNQDRRARLEDRVPALDEIVFHAKLGNVGQRVVRIEELAGALSRHIPDARAERARRGARLAKADLVTEMVGEFPELQGIMGRYYALEQGEDPAVADAIADHYAPSGPNDRCPRAPDSVAVALADKIDMLVGFWGIDAKPTGSKDPFALRRAALGVIRLVLENGLRLPLYEVFAEAEAAYAATALEGGRGVRFKRSGTALADDLLSFLADRLKVHLRDEGVPHDHVAAVFALGGEDDLMRLSARVAALGDFLGSADGANLLIAYRRAGNIVRAEEKNDGVSYFGGDYDPGRADGDEAKLWRALERVEADAEPAIRAERFGDAMSALARLRAPVDAFFDAVTVNVDETTLRVNRLRLLARIVSVMNRVADFSRIEG